MAEIQSLLDGVIEEEITNVKSLEAGTEKKSAATRDLATLHKLRIEEIKALRRTKKPLVVKWTRIVKVMSTLSKSANSTAKTLTVPMTSRFKTVRSGSR